MSEHNIEKRYILPTLFNYDKNDRKRMWKVWTVNNTLFRSSGLVDGKKVQSQRKHKGKNIGKKNETTDIEQAQLVAQSEWSKQIDKGYRPECDEGKKLFKELSESKKLMGSSHDSRNIMSGKIKGSQSKNKSDNLKVGIPIQKISMKAQKWELEDPLDNNSFPKKVLKYYDFDEGVYLQKKLDGFRCIARLIDDKVVLVSNSGREFGFMKSLRDSLYDLMSNNKDLILDGLDGELYNHYLEDEEGNEISQESRFQTIASICNVNRSKPHELENNIKLYVFDLVDLSKEYDQTERFKLLNRLLANKNDKIVKVKSIFTHNLSDVSKYNNLFFEEGYEGVMMRDSLAYYEPGKRSNHLGKYKTIVDKEYTIVDIKWDNHEAKETFVWVVEDPNIIDDDGQPIKFNVTPMGTVQQKHYYVNNYTKYIGHPLTVKYQEMLESGIPRFGRGKALRQLGDYYE